MKMKKFNKYFAFFMIALCLIALGISVYYLVKFGNSCTPAPKLLSILMVTILILFLIHFFLTNVPKIMKYEKIPKLIRILIFAVFLFIVLILIIFVLMKIMSY